MRLVRLCMINAYCPHRTTCCHVFCLLLFMLVAWKICFDVYGPQAHQRHTKTPNQRKFTKPSTPIHQSKDIVGSRNEENITFIQAVAAHASEDKVILLAGTDSAFVDMAVNFYEASLQPFGISNYLFACLDRECCHLLQGRNISCYVYRVESSGTEASDFGSKVFLEKMNVRTDMILEVLHAGFSVLQCDTDLAFLQNPFNHINCGEDCDMAALRDTKDYNAGFIFIRPTNRSIEIYQNMKKIAAKDPKIDDQDQLTMSISAKQKEDKSFKALMLPEDGFLCGLYYFENGNRIFAGDNPCKNCVVVHNNWIVSKAAKIYRFKEHLMWMYDEEEYYSSSTRKYILYENPWVFQNDTATKAEELRALQNALALGSILHRTVILPSFNVFEKNIPKTVAFHFLYLVRKFDEEFRGAYREHMFLQHGKVPDSVKFSRTAPHLIISDITAIDKNVTVSNNTLLHVASRGASVDDIRNWFGDIKDSVLVFHSLYQAFGGFTGTEKTEFGMKIDGSLKPAGQRQFA